MVTFQFVKMSKGQNRLPWVYVSTPTLSHPQHKKHISI